ncbi:hypothetical protein GCM10027321_14870 [Massilia terrae]|uniref:Band 7 domain-containing protein n=1 Tax=Massilia terrae TaxID=1811224 RepID=A0ABT2CUP3_9BURK|nr:hypothetical protein [Massilia terrae]MCS0657669.1 hypothetical protein [Massilia terrae]
MFEMFGFGAAECPRCERKNAATSGYCAGCGLTLGAPRNPPLLRDNRWIAGPDELAVFFGVRELSGIFVKTLRVPATSRAYILQGEKATEVPQGEYEIEGFFTRLNHLLRDQHAEILVTRTAALPVEFEFDDLESAEYLKLSARFTVRLQVEHVPAFARHFMTMPGVIGAPQLRELLGAPVRQLALEFLGARSVREMAANGELRAELDERLQGALKLLLAQYGLAAVRVDTLALRHDKYDANRERVASLWLAADERHVQVEHARHLDEMYDAEEWQKIRREEQQGRQRQRRAELSLDQADSMQQVRSREIELYARVAESESRKQAIDRGAEDVVAELEHHLARQGARRGGEVDEWAHLRALARSRMRAELEAQQQEALQARQLAQQRFSHVLLQQQIRNKIEQALAIEDASRRHDEVARLRAAEALAERRARELDDEQHTARRQALVLANAARKRELERALEWEEEQAQRRRRELLRADALDAEQVRQELSALRRGSELADALARHDKLQRTIDADARHERAIRDVELDAEDRRHAQALDRARMEITRAQSFGELDDTAKLALAPTANAAALADLLKTRVHATMRAEQLAALSGMASTVTVLEAPRRCTHGHAARAGDVFCAACGAALTH